MTPILSFFPCADVSDTSERANTRVATISPHTKRIDRYGNMRSSQRASVGNRSARALEVARRTMSRGWPARSPTFVGMRPRRPVGHSRGALVPCRPQVVGLDYEMDLRGVVRELVV